MQLPLLPWLPQPPPTAAAQPCSGFGLHLFAGLTNPGQSVLAAPQFIGQVTAELAFSVALAFLGSEDLGPAHQGIALLLQLLLRPEHPIVADRLVCEGIGLNLRAIVSHMAEAHHPGLLAEAQDLNEQTLEDIEVEAPELTDAAVVRLLVGGGQPEDQVLVAGASTAARKALPTSWGQSTSPHGDPCSGQQSGCANSPAHSPGPAGNTSGHHARGRHKVRGRQGRLHMLPGAEGLGHKPILTHSSTAITGSRGDSEASLERCSRDLCGTAHRG